MVQMFVELDILADNAEQIIRILSEELYRAGMVKESFADAVIEREKNYPTGLPTTGIGIAIPHADPCHVIKESFAIGKLKKPVIFRQMGEADKEIVVDLVILMGITDSTTQLQAISNIINMFSNEKIVKSIKNCNDVQQFSQIFQGVMNC